MYMLSRNIVSYTNPRHLSTNIPIDITIQVMLQYDLDAVGFKEENVLLQDVEGSKIVKANVNYTNRLLEIKPLESLEQNHHYILELVGGEKGLQLITGELMDGSWFLEFYTGINETVMPPIITNPSNQTIVEGNVSFEWETQENIFYYHLEISDSNTFNNVLWPSDSDVNVFDGKATPDFKYENKRYYARIKAVSMAREESAWSETVQFFYENKENKRSEENIENNLANALESNTQIAESELGLLQGALEESDNVEIKTSVRVKGISVNNKTFNVPIENLKEIHIEFDEVINPNSINSNKIYILGERN